MGSTSQLELSEGLIKQEKNKKSISESPEFINDFGAIFKEDFFVHENSRIRTFKLNTIKKAVLIKKRKQHWNLLCFILMTGFICGVVFSDNYFGINVLFVFLSLVFAVMGFLVKIYQYKFILVNSHNKKEIIVPQKLKNDAKKLIFYLNKRMKK